MIQVWNLHTGKVTSRWVAHESGVLWIDVHPSASEAPRRGATTASQIWQPDGKLRRRPWPDFRSGHARRFHGLTANSLLLGGLGAAKSATGPLGARSAASSSTTLFMPATGQTRGARRQGRYRCLALSAPALFCQSAGARSPMFPYTAASAVEGDDLAAAARRRPRQTAAADRASRWLTQVAASPVRGRARRAARPRAEVSWPASARICGVTGAPSRRRMTLAGQCRAAPPDPENSKARQGCQGDAAGHRFTRAPQTAAPSSGTESPRAAIADAAR